MSTFLYTRASENLARTATITVNTGVEDTAYPKSNLVDHHPEKPGKLTGTTGSWVFQMAGGAKRLDMAALIHPNLTAGLEVRLQGHASSAWGAPTLNTTFTIPARYPDSFPANPWIDLKTLFPVDANRTFEFWRVVIVGANAAAVSIGEIVLASTRRDLGVRNIQWGSERRFRRPAAIHETDLLVRHTYDFGTTVRAIDVEMQPTDATMLEVEQWYRDAKGVAEPFLIVPHSSENDAWLVTFVNPEQAYTRVKRNYNTGTLSFQEMSRGLFP